MKKRQKPPRKGVATPPPSESKDDRKPIKLDADAARDAMNLINGTIQRVLESPEMQLSIRGVLNGRRMVLESIGKPEPLLPWAARLQNLNLGDLWLVPQRAPEVPDAKTEAPPSYTPVDSHDPKNITKADGVEPPKATNGQGDKVAAAKAEVLAKDSA